MEPWLGTTAAKAGGDDGGGSRSLAGNPILPKLAFS